MFNYWLLFGELLISNVLIVLNQTTSVNEMIYSGTRVFRHRKGPGEKCRLTRVVG